MAPVPNCDFYALPADLLPIFDFVFAQPGWQLIEAYSEFDSPLREFRSTSDVVAAHGKAGVLERAPHLFLYSDSLGGKWTVNRIELEPATGGAFRFTSKGWGLVHLYFAFPHNSRLPASHTNHNSEKRAWKWADTSADLMGTPSAWDWAEVTRISRKLNRFIQSIAAGKEASRPVLPEAHRTREAGVLEFV